MKTTAILEALVRPAGLSGREDPAFTAAAELLKGCGQITRTPLGSLICHIPAKTKTARRLMLEAHLDKIGLVVAALVPSQEGFLRVAAVGGVDRRTLPACPVVVHAAGGDIPGVVATLPPHLQEGEQKNPKMEDICIDTALSPEEAKARIRPGDAVSFATPTLSLQKDKFVAGGLDNRAGCAAVILAARMLAKEGPADDVFVTLASMEEVGGPGAATAAFALSPDAAIAVDVSFANTLGTPAHKCGEMGAGPMIGIAPILCRAWGEKLATLAKAQKIPVQYEVMGGPTGTDADAIASSRAGVETALLSIPLRNMHTPVELLALSDIEAAAKLMAAAAREGV